jgi:SHS2 domain-containing protein
MYEVFEHTADIGLRIRNPTLDGLFIDAAEALFALLVVNLGAVATVQSRQFSIAGTELDFLLFDWLNDLLYTFETEKLLLARFDVHVHADGLRATAHGEPVDRGRHQMDHEVKAITYHELKVIPGEDGWLAEVIVDI